MSATILYYGEFPHFSYCENWIAAALDRNGLHCVRLQRTPWFDEQRLLAVARSAKATHLLLSKTPEISADQLRMIREAGLKIIFWTFDWMRHPDNWKWYEPLAWEADICFQTDGTIDKISAPYIGINRIELHQGCVPGLHEIPDLSGDRHSPGEWATFGSDIAFAGSRYTPRREELIRQLTRYDGFQHWGTLETQIWGREFAAMCYLSKIVIGDNFVNDVPGYWSDRVYLTLGCGGFFLTAYVPGLEKLFTNHKHLVWWNSFDELHELIKFYLPSESRRRAIALEGWRLVHSRDTYDHRIQRLSQEIEKL